MAFYRGLGQLGQGHSPTVERVEVSNTPSNASPLDQRLVTSSQDGRYTTRSALWAVSYSPCRRFRSASKPIRVSLAGDIRLGSL